MYLFVSALSEDPLDWLGHDAVKRIINQSRWDEARYLIILYACSRLKPWNAKVSEGLQGFLRAVLRDLAEELGLDFEFYRGARKMLEERLEKDLGYVRTFHGPENFTYYAITPEGSRIAESALSQAMGLSQAMETMLLPTALLDKFKEDLQKRAERQLVHPNVVKQLVAEYENLEPLNYSDEVASTSKARRVRLSERNITLGRNANNILSFPEDHYMSRTHAMVEWTEGSHWIRDMQSKNGVWRIDENGKRVRVSREKLRLNATYEVGTTRLIFVA